MNGTESGKSFFFLYMVMIMPVLIALRILTGKLACLKTGLIDKILLLWILYVIGNAYVQGSSISLRLLEFYGLIALYIALRQFPAYVMMWLYAAIITGGTIQAVFGNLQLWGYYPTHHSLFKITGNFFNPGPYAGYLSGVFTVALGFYCFKVGLPVPESILKINRLKKIELIKVMLLTAMAVMALALAATHSRAAFLALLISSAYLVYRRYKNRVHLLFKQFINSRAKKVSLTALVIILAGSLFACLYHLKKDSANGRLLIWNVSLNMIKDKPVFGYGFDQFKTHYMDYQAAFFEQNPNADQLMVAGDTNYAFNEPLQQTVENGIIGLIIITCILFVIFTSWEKFVQTNKNYLFVHQNPGIPVNRNPLLIIAKAGLINILIFSLFSYPAQILPIKISLVLYLATVANNSSEIKFSLFSIPIKKINRKIILIIKTLLVMIILTLAYVGYRSLYLYTVAYVNWKNAYQSYQFGAYDTCLQDYKKAYPALKTNGDFLTNYGKALSEAGKPDKAIAILKKATKSYPNTVVYTAMGNSYKALNLYALAEQAYLYAWHMNPSRFYPEYLLVKLYDQSGQKEKAVSMANELLHKKIKVESEAIREIKAEMNEIIKKSKLIDGNNEK